MRELLKDAGILSKQYLLGIDGSYFLTAYGKEWTGRLLKKLSVIEKCSLFCMADSGTTQDDADFLRNSGCLVLNAGPLSRFAAATYLCDVIVGGDTVFFHLAEHMDGKVIGLFSQEDANRHFREQTGTKGVIFEESPTEETSDTIVAIVRSLLARE